MILRVRFYTNFIKIDQANSEEIQTLSFGLMTDTINLIYTKNKNSLIYNQNVAEYKNWSTSLHCKALYGQTKSIP